MEESVTLLLEFSLHLAVFRFKGPGIERMVIIKTTVDSISCSVLNMRLGETVISKVISAQARRLCKQEHGVKFNNRWRGNKAQAQTA